MAHRPLILTLAAGAALTIATSACTGPKQPETGMTENPPPPKVEEPPTANPPAPDPEPIADPRPPTGNPPAPSPESLVTQRIMTKLPDRPEFEDVKSPHPEGATNPPSPVLIVTPAGDCFKRWEGGMLPSDGDRVEAATADAMTTAVNCPVDRAKALLKAHENPSEDL